MHGVMKIRQGMLKKGMERFNLETEEAVAERLFDFLQAHPCQGKYQ